MTFNQFDRESIYEPYERLKELLKKCSHHTLSDWLIIQIIYNGLICSFRLIIDVITGDSLMSKPFDEVHALIEELVTNNSKWPFDRVNLEKVTSFYESDTLYILTSQVVVILRKLNSLGINVNLGALKPIDVNLYGPTNDLSSLGVESSNIINSR